MVHIIAPKQTLANIKNKSYNTKWTVMMVVTLLPEVRENFLLLSAWRGASQ